MAAGPETMLRYVRRLVVPSEPDEATDAALLGRFISSADEMAFAALVDRHGPLVLHACQRVLGNVHDAEDAFQAAFLVLARKAATVRPREALPAWLHGVAHRVALKARSARARRLREAASPLAPATDPRPDPLAEISVRELLAIIDEEVGRLPETYRLPVILCCLECRSVEEAARQLGWTRGSVKGRLERGRVRLHQRLVRRGLSLSAALAAAELSRGAASAAVLARLAAATTRGALLFAARSTAATGVSSPAAGLAGDLIKGMALGKIKTGALLVLLLGLLAVGTGLVASPFGGPEQPPKKGAVPRAAIQTVLTDLYGDPLPAGASKRIGTIRFRHGGGMINALLLAPDGKTLVTNTVYGDRNVRAWELATGKLLHQFPGHYEASGAVALTPDGTTVAIGHDSSIRFYDLQSGREVRQLQAPLGNIEGLAFSPDGNTFASGHARQTLLLWSLASGTTLAQLPAQHNRLSVLAFTADGKTLVTGDQFDPTIRLFDVATRRERHQLTRPNAPRHHARAFALSPDGSHLAVVVHQGPLSIWDVKTGRMLRELRGTRFAASAAFSPDGKTLASAESNDKADRNTLALWDVATGKKLRRLNGNAWPVSKVTFSGDGKTLIVGCEGTIRLWDVATGNECGPAAGNPASMGRAVLSADGRTLAYQADDSIRLQDLGLAREVGRLPSQHLTLAFSPDGKVLAGGTAINRVNLWDVEHGRLLRRLQSAPKSDGFAWVGYRHVVFAPDGKLLASAGPGQLQGGGIWDDAVVQLWDLATGKPGRRLTLKDAKEEFCAVEAVAFSPDGKTLAASARDGNYGSKVRVWDAAT
ncbi:MAG: sigma-70 family RNA polymerase sigma factor, partial [Planctomycetota bacterium]